MTIDKDLLDAAFGPESIGETPPERARTSSRRFVRSLFQIAEDSPAATGRKLTAREALSAYGWDVLAEVAAEGYARLADGPTVAGAALERRIVDLSLPLKSVANAAKLPLSTVERLLKSDPRMPLRAYEEAAKVVGLDERKIGVRPEPIGSEALTIRLRSIGDSSAPLTPSAVVAIGEAAWVASTQAKLEAELGLTRDRSRFQPSGNFGQPGYPAFLHGYYLAGETRSLLNLTSAPIRSARETAEETLGIPVVQTELGEHIAGVTVDTGATRAIVVNLGGRNRSAFVRRMTVAHELGHLLWDPTERLNYLRVDSYDDLEHRPQDLRDVVEQRANAFAVEFLAPKLATLEAFRQFGGAGGGGVAHVVRTFGISPTAAKRHIWNALEQSVPIESLKSGTPTAEDRQQWDAAEAYTIDMHPLPALRNSRRGRFSAIVIRSAMERVISWDTAAHFLESSESDIVDAVAPVKQLYPSVFPPGAAAG